MYKTKPKHYLVIQVTIAGKWIDIFKVKTNKKFKLTDRQEAQIKAMEGSMMQVIKAHNAKMRTIKRRIDNEI